MKNSIPVWVGIIFCIIVSIDSTSVHAQNRTVTGKVTDATTNDPMPGVNIAISGTSMGTASDTEGNYQLNVPADADTLIFSFIGYETQHVPISGRSTINVELVSQAYLGEEVIVVGYGTQRRQDLTGSISSISEEDLNSTSITSPEQGLQGRVAGVQVTQSSSEPGGGTTVRIRGGNSITGGSDPLYVIDGFPIVYNNSDMPGNGNGGASSPKPNPLASVNPNDIESITILKDASATAIYGSRGANGVILITTKRGKAGEANVNLNFYTSFQQVANQIDMMNSTQYKNYLREFAENRDQPNLFGDLSQFTANTDWQDEIFRSAPIQSYQASVSGGEEKTRYALSAEYLDNEGVVIGSQFERYSARVNLDRELSEKLRIGNSLTISRNKFDRVPTGGDGGPRGRGITHSAFTMAPFFPVFNPDGSFTDNNFPNAEQTGGNPISNAETVKNDLDQTTILGNLFANYDILENLSVKISAGANLENREASNFYPLTTLEGVINGVKAVNSTVELTSWVNENLLTYSNTFSENHNLKFDGGYTIQKEIKTFQNVSTTGFIVDQLKDPNIGDGVSLGGLSSGKTEWTLISWLGRINYDFKNKYLLTVTGRFDGSSKFGEGNKWSFFPSVGVGYKISEEQFMEKLNLFDELKLRGSYGVTGNQEIGTYTSLARLGGAEFQFDRNNLNKGFGTTRIANPDLKWETTTQYNIGLDIALFDNRFRLTSDYYYKQTDDLLLRVILPSNSGFNTALKNTGSIENKGIEIGLDTDILSNTTLKWSISGNYSRNRNKVLDLGESSEFQGPNLSSYIKMEGNLVREGEAVGVFLGHQFDGVFKNEEEIVQSAQPGAEPGDPRYVDVNNDGIINSDDKVVIGDPNPDFMFGISNNFAYKNFDLSVFFQGVSGFDVLNMNLLTINNPGRFPGTNKSIALLNRWSESNRNSNIPRAGFEGEWNRPSSFEIEDGSYIRLKKVQLTYNFLPPIMQIRNAQLYVRAENLLTITDYSGFNPDVNSTGGNATINRGIDFGSYPLAEVYTIGLNISL